ncbi:MULTISPECIES: [protein-PII] uridylyltransferase [Legionella]|uniref:Bifunctional uridylyltransferase/uridylyl-removing enzyme n=1 Tax=Legionella drozanskii LLAP-1 TaxID=1212489 RepID=A0A0W0TBX6_9GAMM|nr:MULTISPECIES: [protein-PII] uridylyltransferase [Legionella]KTC93065.1 protein-PII uridylyltransferase [Legionella drozanskii LLAP-1]PJE11968.1 MAG: [protein-PII] uridylyltransferase [Legionella sp.]
MKNDNLNLKLSIHQFKDELCEEFKQKPNIGPLTSKLVNFIDEILTNLFHKNHLHKGNKFCLLALGSYGRRELQLYSDVDLLLLHTDSISKTQLQHAQSFIQDCWDTGLEVSHQITTVNACAELASTDLSVISSILDMHLICGRGTLMEELIYQTHPLHMWSSHDYFFAKQQEQLLRYSKYGETAYNLEPNVKNGPGGLRDLQILLSIGKRHFGIKKLADGINCGFISDKEYEELIACQHFLWRVRFALHLLAEKQEERLLFDYQVKLAALFGFLDNEHSLAIEQFMKAYFKMIKRSRELNEMLLQWFGEAIVHHQKQRLTPLDSYFQLSNNYIEVKNTRVFAYKPQALLEIFLWIAKMPSIKGVRASTIRLIRTHLYLIDRRFRVAKFATQTFLAIFKEKDPYDALHHMNRYGVLGHYLDCFATVTGQMQYDLFHVYTVDQHTLFVIRNLARFLKPKYAKQFSLAAKLMPKIENPAILYLAALFHDIAKGRGGDHSELGAEEARQFALRHKLSEDESKLLIWLVRNHLLMSQTAQRQDIYDPKTVQQFCSQLPQADYLEYLYLLTVGDICATNHTLWNAWKDSLLKELYRAAHQWMQQEKISLNETELLHSRQQQALDILVSEGLSSPTIQSLWTNFKEKYFIHQPAEVIARHTKAIINCKNYPLVLIMPHHSGGGIEVFIYMPHRDERFIITTTVLSNHYATIQEAAILTCDNNYDLDSYIILDEQQQVFFDEQRTANIQHALEKQLAETAQIPAITLRRLSRTQAHFKLKPQITFSEEDDQISRLFLVTPDRPGLLASISRVFLNQNIHLHNAKIATAGERAEDMFFISTLEGQALSQEDKENLKQALITELTRLD